jgi:hypothetical protein
MAAGIWTANILHANSRIAREYVGMGATEMACDARTPAASARRSGSECSMDPAECGHAVLPSSDNLLERAFMARIRADEYREALAALQQEFDARPDVIDLKRRIERCEEERRQCIAQAKAAGISKQGSFLLKIRTRKQRTVIPERFFARFGAEAFVKCSTVAIGKAEALLGKGAFDDCCEVEVKDLGVSVEYVRPEGSE